MSVPHHRRIRKATCCLIALVLSASAQAEPVRLPEDWFARYVSERVAPAELTGPVEEKWRVEANAACIRGDRVFLVTRRCPPTTMPATPSDFARLMQARLESTEYAMECRELQTGRVLWKVECGRERPGAPVWFGDLILVRSTHIPPGTLTRLLGPSTSPAATPTPPKIQESIRLLDATNGQSIRAFGPRDIDSRNTDDRTPWPKPDSGPVERFRLDRELLTSTYLNPGGPTAPVPADPSRWSLEDVDLLLNLFDERVIPRCGAVTGLSPSLLTPDGNLFWVDGMRHVLCRTEFTADTKNVWEVPFLAMHCPAMTYTGSEVVLFTSDSSITSYDARTGRPLWTHEWPKAYETYSRSMAVLEDGVLLLTDPQVPRPVIAHPGPVGTTVQFHAQLTLTKLDRQGKVIFKQELPTQGGYSGMLAGRNAVLVYSGGGGLGMGPGMESHFICLAPSISHATVSRHEKQPTGRVEELLEAYDSADAKQRAVICEELAQRGDTRIADRVIADLEAAGRNLEAQALADPYLAQERPSGREWALLSLMKTIDHERVYYVQALGLLKEPRAVQSLLPLLELEYLRQEANTAILAITDGEPLENEAFRTWRERRIPELRARFDREKYPLGKSPIAAQLRMLQDPELLDRLIEVVNSDTTQSSGVLFLEVSLLRDKRAIPWLLEEFDAADPMGRHDITRAIDVILGTTSAPPDAVRAWWDAHRHLYEQPGGGS